MPAEGGICIGVGDAGIDGVLAGDRESGAEGKLWN